MFTKEKMLDIDGIGKVVLRKNKKNRSVRISIKAEHVLVTFPPFVGFKGAEKVVNKNLEWLTTNIAKLTKTKPEIDKKELRRKAKEILPDKLALLAKKFDFEYNRVFLRDTSTRWGSCSTKKNINLSIKLAILPEHLMEYVILHELNHLKYHGHQKDFWDSLSVLCGTNAKALQKELRAFSL
ncbi:MAG: M48 family metallopeptidase [Candidatus Margulisbacteria bacterium]|nr:M48 family metallopeptidase [Candidatus Margulisiibacteriota bacterium]